VLGTGYHAIESGVGATIEAGGWSRGGHVGVFGVAEVAGYSIGNDADMPIWVGIDVRGRTVLFQNGRIRVPFVFGGGPGFEVGYLNKVLVSALAEIGIETDIGRLVLGVRARERLGAYISDADIAARWQSTSGLLVDIGFAFR